VTTYPIAVIGGTGPQGNGLAYRLAKAGHSVVLGSRTEDRPTVAANGLASRIAGAAAVTGATKIDAASNTEITLLATPYDGHDELAESLGAALDGDRGQLRESARLRQAWPIRAGRQRWERRGVRSGLAAAIHRYWRVPPLVSSQPDRRRGHLGGRAGVRR
jgi:NAD(P)-dependent dehydrogenase (short-subunit alcohol dehydrogenase family)